jgi:hypothetical protein
LKLICRLLHIIHRGIPCVAKQKSAQTCDLFPEKIKSPLHFQRSIKLIHWLR